MSTSSIPTNCLYQLLYLHEEINAGADPHPVFFSDRDCTANAQYPHTQDPRWLLESGRYYDAASILYSYPGATTHTIHAALIPPGVIVRVSPTATQNPPLAPLQLTASPDVYVSCPIPYRIHPVPTLSPPIPTPSPAPLSIQGLSVHIPHTDLDYLEYCTGKTRYTTAGLVVDRLTPGSAFCDDLMLRVCSNTALINTPSLGLIQQCSCIWDQQNMQDQLRQWNLPIQCISNTCAQADSNVYRPRSVQTECNALVCEQSLDIHGANIVHQGYQSMTCNQTLYDVTSKTPQVVVNNTDVVDLTLPDTTLRSTPLKLDASFYSALGILIFLLLLLVVWLIRRFYMSRTDTETNTKPTEASTPKKPT